MSPKKIIVTEVLSSRKNPRWNYARFLNIFKDETSLEPCCLKSKPCWEHGGDD